MALLGCYQIQLIAVNIDENVCVCQNEWGQCISDTQTTHMMIYRENYLLSFKKTQS